ncbi:MAG: pyridine nucleotide-disulfide oxidoreductase [Gemmatimonadales bacterium]|nr:MAG: pyridine nucleotide-disulfide oxidoreductase [Gemmatimonadales bacterium]
MKASRWILLAAVAAVVVLFFVLDLDRYFTLEFFRAQQAAIEEFRRENMGLAAAVYFAVYVAVTALSLPGAALMTLVGGAIFGFLWGTVLVSFASTIGATLAFLLGRFLFQDAVQRRFGRYLKPINEGIRRDGALYLFMLRLVPVFPFFVVNLVMALTPMRTVTFFVVSQVGMLAGTMVYVNAGTQIAQVESLGDIVSPGLLGAFALLGIFPLLAKWTARWIQTRKVLRGWKKPSSFDRNLVVIGAGSAGLVTAYIAAAVKAKVSLIEKGEMGGDCLNTGCVPSKTLIRSARLVSEIQRHESFGIAEASARVEMADVMDRVRRVVDTIAPHDSVERYTGLGVDVIQGEAQITGPWSVEVNGRTLTTRNIVVATGARPRIPPIPGLDEVGYHTSDTIWSLRDDPGRFLVLGGGPIGCELSQAFARLGAGVTQVEMGPRLLGREDREVSEFVEARFEAEGIRVLTGHRVVRFETAVPASAEGAGGREEEKVAVAVRDGSDQEIRLPFDTLLVAVGREARVEGFGLQEVGVEVRNGVIDTDDHLRTRVPTIFACGDCVGPYQFTHAASHQAWYAAVNALFSNPFKRFRVDYRTLPMATYTDPEVARVGLNEREAREREVEVEVTRYDLAGQDRALAEEAAHGFVKVLTVPGKDKILGAVIVGPHAGELITEFTLAMKHGIGLNKILGTIHPYPTLMEANKATAGAWKKANAPEGALRWLERYHRWRVR